MIFYFSATGNCRYVADRLSNATSERVFSITDCLKHGQYDFNVENGENIGFVTPVYFWGLPTVIINFIQKLILRTGKRPYVYHVLTYGTITGQAHRIMDKCLKNCELAVNGKYIVQMPDTWTPMYDLTDKEKNLEILAKAEPQIDAVIQGITTKTNGDFNNRKIPLAELYYLTYLRRRNTKKFTVYDSCIGCGLCERICPVSAIEMRNKRPAWVKERCTLCLGCLHRCPTFSIQYGKNTEKHGQYMNPNVKM